MNIAYQNIFRILELSKKLIATANKAEASTNDNERHIFFAATRDYAYEIQKHIRKQWLEQNPSKRQQ